MLRIGVAFQGCEKESLREAQNQGKNKKQKHQKENNPKKQPTFKTILKNKRTLRKTQMQKRERLNRRLRTK